LTAPLSLAAFAVLVLAQAAMTIGLAWRPATLVGLGILAYLVLLDQNRLQPWVYQFLLTGLALAAAPPGWRLRLSRLVVIALYVHSGLSKLDATFAREMGPTFLRAGLRPLGLDPEAWPPALGVSAVLLMPAWEIAVGLGLAWGKTRRAALVGAVILHLALIGILGPFGLGHSTIVLAWNAALIVQVILLFRGDPEPDRRPSAPLRSSPAVAWVVGLAALLPLGERWGIWDTWPSWALYASHNERTEIYLHRDDVSVFPAALRRHLRGEGGDPWLRLDLTGWSREERGVPAYPQDRVANAVAEAIATRYRAPHSVRVVHASRADRWTGRRATEVTVGREAIRRWGDRYWINAHPSGGAAGRWGFGMDPANGVEFRP
jgi:hypothetical protein